MRKKVIVFSFIILCLAGVYVSARNTYTTSWKKVEELEKKSLPTSALTEVDKIYQSAVQEKNNPQVIKALIHKMKYQAEKSDDNWPEVFQQVEQLINETKDVSEKAILHSMMAEMYMQYYTGNSYKINQRSAITGYVPEKMDEWSKNIFVDKFFEHLKASLAPEKELQSQPATAYADVITLGEDSRNMRPSLFDFLAFRSLNLLNDNQYSISTVNGQNPIIDKTYFSSVTDFLKINVATDENTFTTASTLIFQQLLAFHQNDKTHDALLHSDLERIKFVYQSAAIDIADELYLNYLSTLEKEYKNNPLSVEIMIEQANYYFSNTYKYSADKQKMSTYYTTAYDICEQGIKQFPTYKRINLLKNIQAQIKQPNLVATVNEISYPNKEIKFTLQYKNLSKAILKIYKSDKNAETYAGERYNSGVDKISGNLVLTKTIELEQKEKFTDQETEILIDGLNYGIYQYEILPEDKTVKLSKGDFYVSKYTLLKRIRENKAEYYVVDRITGHPVPNATVNIFDNRYENRRNVFKRVTSIPVDAEGYAGYTFEKNQNIYAGISAGEDVFFPLKGLYVYKMSGLDNGKEQENISFFTDRSIYRPGQTVYFKGIVCKQSMNDVSAVQNKEFKLKLFDTNNQEISTLSLKTNEFGSFAGEFVLPQNALNGSFYIQCNNQSHSFLVEEYKRPSIEVTFNKIQGVYTFGDQIELSGSVMNYAGYANLDIPVKYRITRRADFMWRPAYNEEEIINSVVATDADGKFVIQFTPEKKFEDKDAKTLSYNYTLYVETTDSKGETQANNFNFRVSDISTVILADLPPQVKKGTDKYITVSAQNTNGEEVKSFISYSIYQATKKSFNDTLTVSADPVLEGGIDLSETNKLYYTLFNQLPSGSYRIVFSAKDSKNTTTQEFYLYASGDVKLNAKMYTFIDLLKTECNVGENAEILFGTAATDVKVLYQIQNNEKIFESKWIGFNDELRKLSIPYVKEYGDEVTLNLIFVKDEQLFNLPVRLTQKKEDKELNITLTTFRDKLLPGQQEEWTVKITDKKNNIVNAELLASLYDASLDQFAKNEWNFRPSLLRPSTRFTSWSIETGRMGYASANFVIDYKKTEALKFDMFNWFGLNFLANLNSYFVRGVMAESSAVRKEARSSAPMAIMDHADVATGGMAEDGGSTPAIDIRQNFNETAFFYPQLKTNSKGEVLISFTIPESLTRWNFKGLAHTANLQYGQVAATTVTQKPFMITANMPRFVRVGDKLVLNANVVNLTAKAIDGQAMLEMVNPVTEEVVFSKQLTFKCEANSTTPVGWEYDITDKYDMLICRVMANNSEFSDGEQHMLPVLSNKVPVTESMLMNVNGNETKTFTFNNLKNNTSTTLENKSFTVEFTSNPAWYAVQALPYLSAPANDNAISYLTAYYVNTLAGYIANSNPKLAAVFEQWKNQPDSKNALLSNLEKDQELKNILLQETPWVMDATDENEQKQRIALLFDLNNLKNSTGAMFSKLKEMQLPNGAFVWYKGMNEDRYVTQQIIAAMNQLQQMNAVTYTADEKAMLQAAVRYADMCIKDDYEKLKKASKNKPDNSLSATQIYYHFIRSAHQNIAVPSDVKEAYAFYLTQMEQQWTKQNLYEQAMIAVVMNRTGKKNVANNIIASLRERATVSDELGMYWDKNRTRYFWNESAISTQVAIISAFNEITGNQSEIDNMKKWLLKQKQTQKWDSEISSVNAVYALLLGGSDWLANKGDVQLLVAGQEIKFDKPEAGTRYVKKAFAQTEITPALADIKVTKKDNGMAWGAAYWQYVENVDKIEKTKGDFSIDKKLFVERVTNKGRAQEAVTEKTQLKVGDKVTVRLTVRTDRDMEYVCIKDLRAACFEPVQPLSGYRFNEGTGYYQSPKDVSMQYFFNYLPKGTYVFEYAVYVARPGDYANGMASIQCQYAPEFVSHSGTVRVTSK